MTLTFNPLRAMLKTTHMQKFNVNGHPLVPKIEWKQTDGQTDGGDCITSLANAVLQLYAVDT